MLQIQTDERGTCITDGWLTDWVIFYKHRIAWAHDGVFYRLPKRITRKLDKMARDAVTDTVTPIANADTSTGASGKK